MRTVEWSSYIKLGPNRLLPRKYSVCCSMGENNHKHVAYGKVLVCGVFSDGTHPMSLLRRPRSDLSFEKGYYSLNT